MINSMWTGSDGSLLMVSDSILYMRKRYIDSVRSMRRDDANGVDLSIKKISWDLLLKYFN